MPKDPEPQVNGGRLSERKIASGRSDVPLAYLAYLGQEGRAREVGYGEPKPDRRAKLCDYSMVNIERTVRPIPESYAVRMMLSHH